MIKLQANHQFKPQNCMVK